MNKYELLVILSAQPEDAANDALVEKVQKVVESKGVKVESVDKWGVKKYAYKINYKDEGNYVLYNVEADGTKLSEVQKLLNITDGVVRAMFTKKA